MPGEKVAKETIEELKETVKILFLDDLKKMIENNNDGVNKEIDRYNTSIQGSLKQLKDGLPKEISKHLEESEVIHDYVNDASNLYQKKLAEDVMRLFNDHEKESVVEINNLNNSLNSHVSKLQSSLTQTSKQQENIIVNIKQSIEDSKADAIKEISESIEKSEQIATANMSREMKSIHTTVSENKIDIIDRLKRIEKLENTTQKTQETQYTNYRKLRLLVIASLVLNIITILCLLVFLLI